MKFSLLRVKVPIAIALVVIAIITASGFWVYYDLRRPIPHTSSAKETSIAPGASTWSIIGQLHREGILRHETPAWLHMRFLARGNRFKSGAYQFKSPISPLQVMDKLVRGDVATRHFTIPEGYDQFDISNILATLPGLKQSPPAGPQEALQLLQRTSLIADLDAEAKTLEGYLFPDTYEYAATATREQLVELTTRRFRKALKPGMRQRATELGMSVRELVTLASLIEKEAKVDSERELISSVFHNRLRKRMVLACDPTVIYASLIEGRYRGKIYQSDLDRDSPYNTYRRAGLPPGPIASPGARSLQAALYPAKTDFLYFVVDATRNDGSHRFSISSADHERAVATLRRFEREQTPR